MRTRLAAILVMTAAAGLTACGGSSSSSDSGSAAAPASSAPDTSSSAPAATGGAALTIQGFAYSPTPLTVAPGAVVSVTNKDSAPHTVTSDTQGLFNAEQITQDKVVTFTAPAKAGTYTFTCAFHAKMHGTLVVSG